MRVEEAVLRTIIEYKERGEDRVPNYEIEEAHPEHKMSGRARLRDLRKRGYLTYASHDNKYIILTELKDLYESWERLTGRPWKGKRVEKEVEETPESRERILREMREFRESL